LSLWGSFEKDRIIEALDLLAKAIERDPTYGSALALAANFRHLLDVSGWASDPEANRHESVTLVRRALRVGSDDPEVLAHAAFVLGYAGEDIDVALGMIDRSLTLNPSFARGWFWSGVLRLLAGQPDLAIEHFETFHRLNPRDHLGGYLTGIGHAHFFNRRFDDAAAKLLASLEHLPAFTLTYRLLAACYAHLGRLDDARQIVNRLKVITPILVPRLAQFRNPEHRELLVSGLRLAAGETK
jgi:adenylate cyclase